MAATGARDQRRLNRDRRPPPILSWARRFPRQLLRGDVVAGLTVAVMLIPHGMAYATVAGMPPVTGLYAAIVGIVTYVLGTSGAHARGGYWNDCAGRVHSSVSAACLAVDAASVLCAPSAVEEAPAHVV